MQILSSLKTVNHLPGAGSARHLRGDVQSSTACLRLPSACKRIQSMGASVSAKARKLEARKFLGKLP